MPKGTKRIYELAKDYNISSNAMLNVIRELGFKPKSHMSVAMTAMIEAVQRKFAKEKQEAKKEMEHREQVKKAVEKSVEKTNVRIGSIKIDDSKSPVAGIMRRLEKKQKKKERRKKKVRNVDKGEVARSFKTTMATLATSRSKKRYKRTGGGDMSADAAMEYTLDVAEYITLAELAKLMDARPADVITKLFEMGMMATINQRLDMDTIEMIADEFEFKVNQIAEVGEAAKEEEHEENLASRAPVVTVMGHVDHGKTSLLDYIRKTNVVAGEAGAITQHIGAYEVDYNGGKIAFLDTPGHEAFTAMRARGTQITDIVVLVVAADDGVRPQTIEAIDHARAADVPIIVAINKIDKPNANPENIRTQLSNYNLLSEEWGGKSIMVQISAKTGEGIDKLLEMILLQAEMLDLKADPTIRAQGVVIDARLERGLGPTATVLVQRGTASIGDPIVAGVYNGRIRTMTNDRDEKLQTIGPSVPAQITGLSAVPQAGDSFMAVKSEQEAKEIAAKRHQIKREHDSRMMPGRISLEQIYDRIKEGQIRELKLVIKGDVDGSVEVLADTLSKIATDEVKANILHRGVGTITESDVLLASASGAIVIGFHVSPDVRAREVAKEENIDIRLYDIIYEAEKDVKDALSGLLAPKIEERYIGSAEIRNLFKVPKIGVIAGSYVRDGHLTRNHKVRVVRDGKQIYTGNISSLKRFKDDAKEVKEGFECGIGVENFNDLKVGDVIEAFEIVETARTL